MQISLVRGLTAAAALIVATPLVAASPMTAERTPAPIDVQVLALTDLHGYLSPATDSANSLITDAAGNQSTVGGASYLAAQLDAASADHDNSIRVANGDSFTGWQWQVTMTRDEPTVEVLDALDIEVSSVGNHELDISLPFLRDHMQDGQCGPEWGDEACHLRSDGTPFSGTGFPFLAANLTVDGTGEQPFASSYVREVVGEGGDSARVGFIGVTTPAVERIFASYQVGSLEAGEMLAAVDAEAARLAADGVETILVLAHEGASTSGAFDACADVDGPLIELAAEASPLVDAFVGGHWHTAFNCSIAGPDGIERVVVSPGHHGRLFADIRLQIDPSTGAAISVSAANIPVTRDVVPDAAIADTVAAWNTLGAQLWARPTGTISADISNANDADGESPMKNLVADAYRAIGAEAAGEAVPIGLAEPYQVRGSLNRQPGTNPADTVGSVLYGEAWAAQGRGSSVVVGALTGRQIRAALEQQWSLDAAGTEKYVPLGLSGVKVIADPEAAIGSRIVSVRVGKQPLHPRKSYAVAMSSRLALGMDGFSALTDPGNPARSDMDYFAFTDWWRSVGAVTPPATDRVRFE